MWRDGEKRSAAPVLGLQTEACGDSIAAFMPIKLVKKGGQAVKNLKNFHKRLADDHFYRHNRGLRLSKGVSICPN